MRALFLRFGKGSKASLAAVCLFLISSIMPAQAVVWNKDVTEADVLEMARPMTSVVQIKSLGDHGSGVLLSTGKHVLTAKHVVLDPLWRFFGYEVVSGEVHVIVEDEAGRKTSIMAKDVYLHPSEADIAIIELQHPVDQLLDEDGSRPAITPSPLYREDPRNLCGELLHGAGYGCRAMEMDETWKAPNGNRYYYETFFNFVLDTPCPLASRGDLSRLEFNVRWHIHEMEHCLKSDRSRVPCGLREPGSSREEALSDDLSWIRAIIDSVAHLDGIALQRKWTLHHLAVLRSGLKDLSDVAFEIRVDKKMRDAARFMGGILSGDSGSPLFDKENRVVAVITSGTKPDGNLLEHSGMGELVYPFLDWIDDVMAGREEGMLPAHSMPDAVAVDAEMKIISQLIFSYFLDSVAAGSPPHWCLSYVLAYFYVRDYTGPAGLIIDALFQDHLFSSLEEASYLGLAIQVFFMNLRS